MKRLNFNILQVFILVFCVTVFVGCEKDEERSSFDLKSNEFELDDNIVLLESTQMVSQFFYDFGVSNVYVSENQGYREYKVQTQKTFNLNGTVVNLEDYVAIVNENTLYLENDIDTKLTIVDGEPYVISNDFTGFLNQSDMFSELNFNILLFFMNEVLLDEASKIDVSGQSSKLKSNGCGFWDTYHIYAFGHNRSLAEANLQDEVELHMGPGGALSSCRTVGLVDTSCILENHACVATQAVCCD